MFTHVCIIRLANGDDILRQCSTLTFFDVIFKTKFSFSRIKATSLMTRPKQHWFSQLHTFEGLPQNWKFSYRAEKTFWRSIFFNTRLSQKHFIQQLKHLLKIGKYPRGIFQGSWTMGSQFQYRLLNEPKTWKEHTFACFQPYHTKTGSLIKRRNKIKIIKIK